ncbi:unnamed protein product [Prunus armeniaca]
MEKYQDHPNWYYASTQVRHFVEQCRACENREAIFREAFDVFFRQGNVEALSGMRVAATTGHMEAAYLVGLLGMSKIDMFHYGKIKFNQCSACNNNDWCFVIPGWPSEEKNNPAFWTCCNRCKWHHESVFWFKVMRVYVVPGNPYPYN